MKSDGMGWENILPSCMYVYMHICMYIYERNEDTIAIEKENNPYV